MNCCICGDTEDEIIWCHICSHYFCGRCRGNYFHRGRDAVKEWLFKRPPKHCNHERSVNG